MEYAHINITIHKEVELTEELEEMDDETLEEYIKEVCNDETGRYIAKIRDLGYDVDTIVEY